MITSRLERVKVACELLESVMRDECRDAHAAKEWQVDPAIVAAFAWNADLIDSALEKLRAVE